MVAKKKPIRKKPVYKPNKPVWTQRKKRPAKPPKKPTKKDNSPHIRVYYPPSKAHLYPKSHPSYRPKKK